MRDRLRRQIAALRESLSDPGAGYCRCDNGTSLHVRYQDPENGLAGDEPAPEKCPKCGLPFARGMPIVLDVQFHVPTDKRNEYELGGNGPVVMYDPDEVK
jgi:hypothetical protein